MKQQTASCGKALLSSLAGRLMLATEAWYSLLLARPLFLAPQIGLRCVRLPLAKTSCPP
jgi:hypothetical protein